MQYAHIVNSQKQSISVLGLMMHRNLAISILTVALFMIAGDADDTLSKGQPLTESNTLLSKNGRFELGFFPPNHQTQHRFYLSIRHTHFKGGTIVWTAITEKPLTDKAVWKLEISEDGNLKVYHGPDCFWSTNVPPSTSPDTVVAVLGDNGNLILKLRDGGRIWQSFDHPTNTWLPGAALGFDKSKGGGQTRRLVSWKSDDDPSPGLFSAEISESREMVLKLNATAVYWESRPYMYNQFEFAQRLTSSHFDLGINQNYVTLINDIEFNDSSGADFSVFSMIVMDHAMGRLVLRTWWWPAQQSWQSDYLTESFEFCGAYGVLNTSEGSSTPCTCLPGFSPLPGKKMVDFSCSRPSPLDCKKKVRFEEISEIKLPEKEIFVDDAATDKDCKLACLNRCSSCTAYAFNHTGCLIWEGDLNGLRHDISNNQKLHLKLPKGKAFDLEVIIGIVVPVLVLLSCGLLGFFYNRRAKQKEENKEPGEDLLYFDFDRGFSSLRTRSNTEFDLPMFSYESVSAATNNFSPENKLGQGGFGPVYKGIVLNGQEIALKRLSKKSGQGFEEFRNEILLIAKLQHRNLVCLLGFCINPDESILIYEYMPNKSLDFFLFGTDRQEILDWKTRIHIVEGIAQGLLYLHEHSRVRIIHRDLKASNILLDDEMNPKISDFGVARIFGGNDSRAHTNKVVGTFGYIAPEYAMEGLFSTKSDVYSFGVLVLEIVSGRKNTGFYKTDSLNLLGHAWDLWVSDRGVELVDDKVGSTALRYINVGLLCVQENPNDRPSMSSVVSMLRGEIAALPPPKKPAFSTTRGISSISSVKNSGGESVNDLTVSVIEPR